MSDQKENLGGSAAARDYGPSQATGAQLTEASHVPTTTNAERSSPSFQRPDIEAPLAVWEYAFTLERWVINAEERNVVLQRRVDELTKEREELKGQVHTLMRVPASEADAENVVLRRLVDVQAEALREVLEAVESGRLETISSQELRAVLGRVDGSET